MGILDQELSLTSQQYDKLFYEAKGTSIILDLTCLAIMYDPNIVRNSTVDGAISFTSDALGIDIYCQNIGSFPKRDSYDPLLINDETLWGVKIQLLDRYSDIEMQIDKLEQFLDDAEIDVLNDIGTATFMSRDENLRKYIELNMYVLPVHFYDALIASEFFLNGNYNLVALMGLATFALYKLSTSSSRLFIQNNVNLKLGKDKEIISEFKAAYKETYDTSLKEFFSISADLTKNAFNIPKDFIVNRASGMISYLTGKRKSEEEIFEEILDS
ncbi:MAG: hypothetical protein KAJ88_05465 [Candidatus Aenigmarchaeota archaeon]|nr:hypothetical protein [Candidatus Aenigmarchaeota archaeon]MCK5235266.1 hypothetical protein [Candidatus Aenigmarchaeota archaeon]